MSDIVKVIFDGELGPLQGKQALAKGELNAFVAESEAKVKGISGVGDAIGVSAQKGVQSFSQYYKPVINDVSRDIKSLSAGFEKVLGVEGSSKARAGLDDLGVSLKKLNLDGYEAAASSQVLNSELQSINKQLGAYQLELASATKENIFFTESQVAAAEANKVANFNLQGSVGSQPLRGYGAIFQATGLRRAGINEMEANAALAMLAKFSGGGADDAEKVAKTAKALAEVTAATTTYQEAEELLRAAKLKTAAATLAEEAAAKVLVLTNSLDTTTDAQLIAAQSALLASTQTLAVAKAEETAVTLSLTAAAEALAVAEAEAAVAAGAAAVSMGVTLAVLLPLAVAGAVFYEWTKSTREEAERLKKEEEGVAEAYARQLKYQRDLSIELARQRSDAQGSRELETYTGALGGQSIEQLQQRKKELSELLNLQAGAPNQYNIETKQFELSEQQLVVRKKENGELLAIEAEIYKKQQQQMGSSANLIDQDFKVRQKAAEDRKKAEEEELTKHIQSVKEANAEVLRLTKGYKAEFDTLFLATEKDNPFATQITQNAKALEVLEDKLKGVTPELKNEANALFAAANAHQQYTLQIDNAFQSIDLHAQADRFRNPTQQELQGRLNAKIGEFQRTSNSTNPDVFLGFQREQQQINEAERVRTQEIIDKKLNIASRAKTPEDQAIADKAVTAFASGLNPDNLTQSERSRIADAYERSAARNESRQEEAIKIQRKLLSTMEAIDKRGEALTGIANRGGKAALDITVKDDTSGGISVNQAPRTPIPDDTKELYAPSLLVGGAGGLSNI